ncbi:MAG: type II toxin-antitoxin system HicA family toxin [Patescibacteria group bacterium]
MSRIPNVTPRQMINALHRAGFHDERQIGSHFYLFHSIKNRRTGIPMHPGDLDRSLMKKIIKQADLTEDEFRRLL